MRDHKDWFTRRSDAVVDCWVVLHWCPRVEPLESRERGGLAIYFAALGPERGLPPRLAQVLRRWIET